MMALIIKSWFLIIILTCLVISIKANHLLVDKLRMDFIKLEQKLWSYVQWETFYMQQEDVEFEIVKALYNFDQNMKQMPKDILRGTEPIRNIHAFLFLYSEVLHTENLYEKFRQYQEDQMRVNNIGGFKDDKKRLDPGIETQFILKDILNRNTGANVTVNKVYNLTFGSENMVMEIVDLILNDYYCKGYNQSPQQVFYNLYNVLALNGLKSYIMLQFAYLAQKISDKGGNSTDLSEIARVQFEKRVNETMSVFRGAMEIAPMHYWKCDPKEQIKGKTYEEFTRLLQGHIQNEVDMNNGGTCRESCDSYPTTKNHGCYDGDSKYCREIERCNGQIIKCRFVESHMEICPSQNPLRRYDHIVYESGKTYGEYKTCWKKPVNSWWRWFVHCSYCLCLCDEQGPKSDRYISMRPVLADIKNNRVVTGIKFTKHNRILHLQIQEGKLMPYGYIDNTTVRWAPVDNYKITDPDVYNEIDYFTLTYENRSMALDDIELEKHNSILTGVRFQFINGKLRLQVHYSTFDWETGRLSPEQGTYIYQKLGGRKEIDLSKVDVPTKSPKNHQSQMNVNDDSYIKFTNTAFELDAAQTTVPFLDMQPVTNEPAVPLMGAGIYYKNLENYGGYIAPKIMTYDYSQLILVRFPRIDVKGSVREIDVAPN
ncbi:unnamed protein product [Ceutorhynchus assimilis]|uniref:Uncharacterized protein n=1 Tax=Ceutorhynchus assimilis TaxID=467358 RepID=A0A9N9QT40_9CUCU|nr:unnamed protein product [Ceutorhynchus assimilis]